MHLLEFPNEVLFEIASHLPYYETSDRPSSVADLNNFTRTCRRLHLLLASYLLSTTDGTDILLWAIEHDRTDTISLAIRRWSSQGTTLNTLSDSWLFEARRLVPTSVEDCFAAIDFATLRCCTVTSQPQIIASPNMQPEYRTLKFLLEAGASVTPTGMAIAVSHGELSVMQLYFDHGASANYRCNNGWSMLHYAVSNGELEATKVLLDLGADVHHVHHTAEGDDFSILSSAVINGVEMKMLELLLDAGADASFVSADGLSLAEEFVSHGGDELDDRVAILVSYGSRALE